MEHLYYYKLDVTLPDLDISKLKGELFRFLTPSYYSYHIKDLEYFQKEILNHINFVIPPDRVFYTEILIDQGLYPHVDENNLILNYYINAENCKTLFYNLRVQDTIEDVHVKNTDLKKARNYQMQELKVVDSFTAKDGEFYFVNGRKIHNVYRYDKGSQRNFIRWEWDNISLNEYVDKLNG